MGASDSAQASDLVGIYLLCKLHEDIPEIGGSLYRDDALFLVRKPTPRQLEYYKKKLKFFK